MEKYKFAMTKWIHFGWKFQNIPKIWTSRIIWMFLLYSYWYGISYKMTWKQLLLKSWSHQSTSIFLFHLPDVNTRYNLYADINVQRTRLMFKRTRCKPTRNLHVIKLYCLLTPLWMTRPWKLRCANLSMCSIPVFRRNELHWKI